MLSVKIMWIIIVISLFILLGSGFLKVLITNNMRKALPQKTKKKKQADHSQKSLLLNETLLECLSIIMEMLSVVVGALLAIILTIYSTNQQDIEKLTDNLSAARNDISIQAELIGELIDFYDESDSHALVMDTSVDLTLLHYSVNSDVGLDLIPGSALGCIMSNNRAISERASLIKDNELDIVTRRRLVEEIKRFLEYLVTEIDLVIAYLNEDISVSEYEAALLEHIYMVKEENEIILSP